MKTVIKRKAFSKRMQVLGFENKEIKVIWNVMTTEAKPIAKEDFNSAIEFLKLKHS